MGELHPKSLQHHVLGARLRHSLPALAALLGAGTFSKVICRAGLPSGRPWCCWQCGNAGGTPGKTWSLLLRDKEMVLG